MIDQESNLPPVCVIIPVFNDQEQLPLCLESLLEQNYEGQISVVVVDNRSTDRTREVVSRFPDVILLQELQKQSSYAARNRGISNTDEDIIAFIDSDCIADRDWLSQLVNCVLAGNDIVGGEVKVRVSDPPNLVELYDRFTAFRQKVYIQKGGFSGAGNLMVRRSIFDEIGMFNPELVSNGDAEFGQRARQKGYCVKYCENAVVFHPARSSFLQLFRKQVRVGNGAGQRLAARNLRVKRLLLLIQEPFRTLIWIRRTTHMVTAKAWQARTRMSQMIGLLGLIVVFAIGTSYGRVSGFLKNGQP